jgi:hypothetical protein
MKAGEAGVNARLSLDQVASARGEHVGHAGQDIQRKTGSHRAEGK